MKTADSHTFRFDEAKHEYFINDKKVPSITQLIEMGELDPAKPFYTASGRHRGQDVHDMTMAYDLGVVTSWPEGTPNRGSAMAYVSAVRELKPTWEWVEVFDCHPDLGFGGRIDRGGEVWKRKTVLEIKRGAKASRVRYKMSTGGEVVTTSHSVQLALQAILAGRRWNLPPHMIQRISLYLRDSGKHPADEHTDRRDFDVAMDLIRRFCV